MSGIEEWELGLGWEGIQTRTPDPNPTEVNPLRELSIRLDLLGEPWRDQRVLNRPNRGASEESCAVLEPCRRSQDRSVFPVLLITYMHQLCRWLQGINDEKLSRNGEVRVSFNLSFNHPLPVLNNAIQRNAAG